jgi:hypothetical protein
MIGVVTSIGLVPRCSFILPPTHCFPFVVSVLSYSFVVLSDLRALGGDTGGTREKCDYGID